MLRNKYAKDYRIEAYSGKGGKVKEKAVYVGPLYSIAEVDLSRQIFRKMTGLFIISLVLFVSSLWNYTGITRVLYVSLPLLGMPVVFYLYFTALMHVRSMTGTFDREHKEKGTDRLKGIGVTGMVVSGIVLTGAVVRACICKLDLLFWDWYFLAASVLQIPLYAASFFFGKKIVVTEEQNPDE